MYQHSKGHIASKYIFESVKQTKKYRSRMKRLFTTRESLPVPTKRDCSSPVTHVTPGTACGGAVMISHLYCICYINSCLPRLR